MPTTHERGRELERLRAELQGIFKAAETGQFTEEFDGQGKSVKVPVYDMDENTCLEVQRRNSELAVKDKQYMASKMNDIRTENEAAQKDSDRPFHRIQHEVSGQNYLAADEYGAMPRLDDVRLSLGERVITGRDYKARSRNRFSADIGEVFLKTLLTTSAGYAPPNPRTGVVIDFPQRQVILPDIIPTDPTSLQTVKYMRQTTETNAAATVSEGAAKPESTFVWTEQSSPVVKIAHWVPVTEEQVDDVPGFQALLNGRMVRLLWLAFENKLLNSPGGTDMAGFYYASIGTQSKGSDDMQDAIFKAMQSVRFTGFAEPDYIAINPTDWSPIRLARTTGGTAGLYIWGHPSQVGPETLWGKPVLQTPAITVGHPITGDFGNYSHISMAMGVRVDVSDSHSDYFVRNQLAVRCEMKASLEIYRTTAFVQIVA